MRWLRWPAYLLPQITLLLFEAGSRDLLGGWNQTDAALGTLLALFVLSPLLAVLVLVLDGVASVRGLRPGGAPWPVYWSLLSLAVVIEALAVDFYLLTHVRM